MFKLLAMPILLLSSMAMADEAQYKLPAAIQCISNASSQVARKFSVTKLNTKNPEISIEGIGLMEPLEHTFSVSVGWSDECENIYSILLYGSDLEQLGKGKVQSVKGLVNYENDDVFEARRAKKEDNVPETAVMTCTLAK